MKFAFIFLSLSSFLSLNSFGQSKVFKEVSNEIASEMKAITQDESLVGYLLFSQLEKADKDSFNYQVTIMDENLNDIGKVNFREKNLELHMVTFGQDVLCLTYLKSDIADLKSISKKEIKNSVNEGKNHVFSQIINLEGKVIYSGSQPVDLTLKSDISYVKSRKPSSIAGYLKQPINVKNISGEGFIIFYGDDNKNRLMAIDNSGKQLWEKTIPEAQSFNMLTTSNTIYLLSKKKGVMVDGGYGVTAFNVKDGVSTEKFDLKDKKGNSLKVLDFENDPATGKPVVSGNIINSKYGNNFMTPKHITKGTYDGVFTILLNGPKKSDIKETFSYWGDGSQSPNISTRAKFSENESFPRFSETVRDNNGNTYFVGSSLIKKTKWGAIASSVVLAPLIVVSPFILAMGGTQKYKIKDAMLVKQNANGGLTLEKVIPGDDARFYPNRMPLNEMDTKSYYSVFNSNTKTNFLIVDDVKNIVIYNINSKKIERTVSHTDGQVRTNIYPAKEGYIMVSEYNKKEKYTRLSIEAL